jgi:hypothetical protein
VTARARPICYEAPRGRRDDSGRASLGRMLVLYLVVANDVRAVQLLFRRGFGVCWRCNARALGSDSSPIVVRDRHNSAAA